MNANPASQFLLRLRGPALSIDFPLPWGYTSIGGNPASALVINDQQAQRNSLLHIGCTAQGGWILNRSNATLRNGEPMPYGVAVALTPGDRYTLGEHTIEIVAYPEVQEEAAAPASREPAKLPAAAQTGQAAPDAQPPPIFFPPTRAGTPRLPPPATETAALHEILPRTSVRFIHYLPELYSRRDAAAVGVHNCAPPFMPRFLGLFESLYLPIEWVVANFDLWLDLRTTPAAFLTWWESWFDLPAASNWSVEQRRRLLTNAYALFGRRGTRAALAQALELFTGYAAEVEDQADDLPPHTFRVRVHLAAGVDPHHVAELIELFRPAHTTYELVCLPLQPPAAAAA